MTSQNDPWVNSSSTPDVRTNEFDDNFVHSPAHIATSQDTSKCLNKIGSKIDTIFTSNYLSNEEYAKKLEEKLKRLQKQKQPSGKDMLENMKERKDFYLNELLSGLDVHDDITINSPSFLDRLYSTNGVYRHLNPQQALDSSEKEPFAKHDYLAKTQEDSAITSNCEINEVNVKE